jgi:hypothetical protein
MVLSRTKEKHRNIRTQGHEIRVLYHVWKWVPKNPLHGIKIMHWDKNINSYLERSILLHAHLLPPTDRTMTPTPLAFLAVSKLPTYIANRYDHKSPPKFANIREPNLKSNFKNQWAYHLHSAQDGNENKWFGIAQKQYHNSHDWHFGHFPSYQVQQSQPFVSVFRWKVERDNVLCWARKTQKVSTTEQWTPALSAGVPITGG